MKIVFDNLIYSWQRSGGISVVWSNLITRILNKVDDVQIIEYENASDNISRKELCLPEKKVIYKNTLFFRFAKYFNPSLRGVSVKKDERFIFHSSYYRTVSHPGAFNVITVHDFAYELFVNKPITRLVHCWQKHRAIRKADYIICISENTKKDLLQLLPDVAADRVAVVYNGVDNRFSCIDGVTKKNYVLYVGNRDRYKNFTAIIEPLAKLGRELKIVGKPILKKEKQLMDAAGLVYEYCGMVSDEELNILYNEAFCLMYTSLYEGFGLPVLEAQMAGCPVIAYNASSIPEVIGDDRMLINEISVEEISKRFDILSNEEQRKEIVNAGIKNAMSFSWDRMADEYLEIYKKLMKE